LNSIGIYKKNFKIYKQIFKFFYKDSNASQYYCDTMLTLCRFETKENLSDENILKKQGFISNVFKNLIEKDVGKKNTVLQVNNKKNN